MSSRACPPRMAVHFLCAITDEEGDFLYDPDTQMPGTEMPPSMGQGASDSFDSLAGVDLFGPAHRAVRLSWIEQVGVTVIQVFGVERMPIWFLVLLACDLALALLVFCMLR